MKGLALICLELQANGKRMKSSSVEIKWKVVTWFNRYFLTVCLVCFTGLVFPASKFVLCGLWWRLWWWCLDLLIVNDEVKKSLFFYSGKKSPVFLNLFEFNGYARSMFLHVISLKWVIWRSTRLLVVIGWQCIFSCVIYLVYYGFCLLNFQLLQREWSNVGPID